MNTYQIISLVVSILSLLGFGTIFKILITESHEKKKAQSAEAKAQAKKEKQDEMREVVREEIASIKAELNKIQESNILEREALQASLRDRLYSIYRMCAMRGYTSKEERDNFENIYKSYHKIFENGVMEDTHKRFFAISSEEEVIGHSQKGLK